MTTVPKRRRPTTATTPGDARSALVDQWLGRYASDPAFQGEVEHFAVEQAVAVEQIVAAHGDENARGHVSWWTLRAASPAFESYTRAVESFAALWHLEALPGERGYVAVHDYCLAHIRHGTKPQHFAEVASSTLRMPTPVMDPRLKVSLEADRESAREGLRSETEPTSDEHREAWRAAQDVRRAVWQPTRERRQDAKTRIMAELERQLDAELDRIADEHERARFTFADTTPEQHRHLWWTYQHVVLGRDLKRIYDDDATLREAETPDGEDTKYLEPRTVGNAVAKMRKALGLPPSTEPAQLRSRP